MLTSNKSVKQRKLVGRKLEIPGKTLIEELSLNHPFTDI